MIPPVLFSGRSDTFVVLFKVKNKGSTNKGTLAATPAANVDNVLLKIPTW